MTPQFYTLTLTANQEKILPAAGKHLFIASCSISSVRFAFDDESLSTGLPGQGYEASQPFRQVRFRDDNGAGLTLTCFVSDHPVRSNTDAAGLLASLQTLLTAIEVDTTAIDANTDTLETLLEIVDTPTEIPATTIAIDGGADTALVTAAAANRVVFIQADDGNTAYVYLTFTTNPATSAAATVKLAPGDVWREECAWAVRAVSTSGTEQVRGYVGAIS